MTAANVNVRHLGAVAIACSMAGCASIASAPFVEHVASPGPVGECARFFEGLNQHRAQYGKRDADAVVMSGYPYLRVDRFAIAWKSRFPAGADSDDFRRWAAYFRRLDYQARRFEIETADRPIDFGWPAEFDQPVQSGQVEAGSGRRVDSVQTALDSVERCGELLLAHDTSSGAGRRRLHRAAMVPSSYRLAHRVLGPYPITSVPFALAVSALHRDTHATFRTPRSDLPVRGKLIRYVPSPEGSGRGAR